MATSFKVTFANEHGLPLTQTESSEKCSELQIPLLNNSPPGYRTLCWFNSSNFALFHKKRPEFDIFFENMKDDTKLKEFNEKIKYSNIVFTKDNFSILEELYNHYNGTKIQKSILPTVQRYLVKGNNFDKFFTQKPTINQKIAYKLKEDSNLGKIKAIEKIYKEVDENIKDNEGKIIISKNPITTKENVNYEHDFSEKDNKERNYIINEENNTYFIFIEIDEGKRKNNSINIVKYKIPLTEEQLENNFEKLQKLSSQEFSLVSGRFNDSSEYISNFINLKIFETGVIEEKQKTSDSVTTNYKDSYITGIKQEKIKILDLIFDYNYTEINDKKTIKERYSTDTYTFIIEAGIPDENDINFIETLIVPLFDKNNPTKAIKGEFKLDSVILYLNRTHYIVVFKCEKNGKWYYYNDSEMNLDQTLDEYIQNKNLKDQEWKSLQKEFNSFKDIMNVRIANSGVFPNKTARLFIYSREKTENNK